MEIAKFFKFDNCNNCPFSVKDKYGKRCYFDNKIFIKSDDDTINNNCNIEKWINEKKGIIDCYKYKIIKSKKNNG